MFSQMPSFLYASILVHILIYLFINNDIMYTKEIFLYIIALLFIILENDL